MMYKLPPLNLLHVFEAVARLGSVRQAANELCRTPPAVSHQLAKLEDYLGTELFARRGRSLYLTEVGSDYLTEITPSLDAIGRATAIASRNSAREILTVAAPPSFTSMWLIPRLNRFIAAHPEFDIRLLDRMTLNPNEHSFDAAIEYRFEPDPSFTSRCLFADEMVPLVSPDFAAAYGPDCAEALEGLTLIETNRRLTSWKALLSDFSWLRHQRFITVGYSLHAFEAAANGMGVALGNAANAGVMLDSGRLVVPFNFEPSRLPPAPHYFLSIPEHKEQRSRVATFVAWLDAELASAGNSTTEPVGLG